MAWLGTERIIHVEYQQQVLVKTSLKGTITASAEGFVPKTKLEKYLSAAK